MRALLTLTIVLASFIPSWAGEYLYIHNTYSGTLSKISIPEHEVVKDIEIGYYMDYVKASPDDTILYVNRIEGDMPGARARNVGVSGELIALDTKTDEILWRMDLDGMPHHMSVSKNGKHVFVPYYDTWWVAVVDAEQQKIVKKIWVGHGSHGTRLSKDGKYLFVGSMMNDTLTQIDTDALEVVDVYGFRDAVRPFDFTDDLKTAYVQQSWLHGFIVLDLNTKEQRVVKLPEPDGGVAEPDFYPHNVNHGILLTHDESELWANGSVADFVAVYSHPDLELLAEIPVGRDPNSIAFSKDGTFAYVSNRGSGDLSVIDTKTKREVERIPLGKYPQRMAVVTVEE